MIVVLKPAPTEEMIRRVVARVEGLGLKAHVIVGSERTVVAAVGNERNGAQQELESCDEVEKVLPILAPYKIASRETRSEPTVVTAGSLRIGGGHIGVIAGPCSVENEEQILLAANQVKAAGATGLRGGAFKPRTSPYSFHGLKDKGLELLAMAREATGLAVVTEVMTPQHVELVAEHADVLQIGARNMFNYRLLQRVGRANRPVLLKRGFEAKISEFLNCAEYILKGGNGAVILCERGIRIFDTEFTRNTLDLSAVPVLKRETHLPVIVDPSHATGVRDLVVPMARAAVAAGADGIMVEVHPRPEKALSDAHQTLTPAMFDALAAELKPIVALMGRRF